MVAASALAERVGPFWGALVACLPVATGPAYVFLALQHDVGFVAGAALNSFAGNAATGVYLAAYALLAPRAAPAATLILALLTWSAAAMAILPVHWTPLSGLALSAAVYGAGFMLPRPVGPAEIGPRSAPMRRWFDLPLRAACIAGFVTAVVAGSSVLGASATGLAAIFPIGLTSLFVILRPRLGAAPTALLATTALRAMPGFSLMLLTLHLAIVPLGEIAAFLLALAVSLAWSGGLMVLKSRFSGI